MKGEESKETEKSNDEQGSSRKPEPVLTADLDMRKMGCEEDASGNPGDSDEGKSRDESIKDDDDPEPANTRGEGKRKNLLFIKDDALEPANTHGEGNFKNLLFIKDDDDPEPANT